MIHIQLERVASGFGRKPVLRDLSLTVEPGTVYALLGGQGSGKSAVIDILAGNRRADGGRAIVLGVSAWASGPRHASPVAVITGGGRVNPWLTARQLARFTAGSAAVWDHALADDIAARLELPMDVPLRELPEGAQVCAELIAAAGRCAPVVLLDEPTAGMDAGMRQRFLDVLPVVARECRSAVLVASAFTDVAAVADRGGLLEGGRIAQDISRMEMRLGAMHGFVEDAGVHLPTYATAAA